MKTIKSLFVLCATLLSLHAQADVSMNSIRITADDPLAVGEFYKTVFGMQEVNRLNLPGGGTIVREPFVFGDSGITIGMINDPAGNTVEMLQQP